MTKRKIHLFNNDCEMAVLNKLPHYTPPKNVKRLRDDLSSLPICLADEGDAIVSPQAITSEYVEFVRVLTGKNIHFISLNDTVDRDSYSSCRPWGMAPDVCQWMEKMGLKSDTMDWSADYAQLYNRETTMQALSKWQLSGEEWAFSVPQKVDVLDELETITSLGDWVVKTPWSASGRGVLFINDGINAKNREWLSGMLKRQERLLVERMWNKVVDFAFEYEINAEGNVLFLGISLFMVGLNGEYMGNRVTSQETIRKELTKYISLETLEASIEETTRIIKSCFASRYRGYLGVDQLIHQRDANHYSLVPFIEINFRTNMGIIALALSKMFPHVDGIYSIRQFASSTEAREYYALLNSTDKNQLVQLLEYHGIPLTYIDETTHFVAELRNREQTSFPKDED